MLFFNTGLPSSQLLSYFRCILKHSPDAPLVSVGSGSGYVEKKLEQELGKHFICVDPLDYEYKQMFIEPHYSSTEKLAEENPSLIGECVLFLNWPLPNRSSYDLESIGLLKPKFVVLVYDCTGAAGSSSLLRWMESVEGVPTSEVSSRSVNCTVDETFPVYKKSMSYLVEVELEPQFKTEMQTVLLLLERADNKHPLDVSELDASRNVPKEAKDSCCIQ